MQPESNLTPSSQKLSEGHSDGQVINRYPMAPLIRFTLVVLYLALVLPLPTLAPPGWRLIMSGAVPLGLLSVVAATSEMVEINGRGIRVSHPFWCRWLFRRSWTLSWDQVVGLTPVSTSQGGRVYYVRSHSTLNQSGEPSGSQSLQAFLLPQRVARFEDFLLHFTRLSGIDTSDVMRLTPPWTYQLLFLLSTLLLGGEALFLTLRYSMN